MKKIAAILLVLCLCPLCAWAETAGTPNETDYTALIQAIFEANQLEALFSRHESLQFLSTNPAAPDGYDVIWETADAYYQSFSDYYAVYAKDQIIYMFADTGAESLLLFAAYDYDRYFVPYSMVAETEDQLVDPAHERLTESYEEDGKLYLITEYDAFLSQQALESMSLEYTGQTVMTRWIIDAETHEILANHKFIVENGEETVFKTMIVCYDRPEPIACRLLRAAFERGNVVTINVTYVVDPGTDHEAVKTITVPANTNCELYCLSVPFVYFYDLEQTSTTGWDGTTDVTVYFYTNPDEALIQHFQEVRDAAEQE